MWTRCMSEAANHWRDRPLLLTAAAEAGFDVGLPGPGLSVGRAGSPVTIAPWIEQTPWRRVTPPQLTHAAGLPATARRLHDLRALSELLVHIARVAATPPPQAEALGQLRARVGQDIFRRLLLQAHQGRCAVTGLSHPCHLRARRIKPWAECDTN